jgi:hypothetical protein
MNGRRRLIRKEAKKLGTYLMFSRVRDETPEEFIKRRNQAFRRLANATIHRIKKHWKYKGLKLVRTPKMRVKIKRKK